MTREEERLRQKLADYDRKLVELRAKLDGVQRALESLTPGGSEFVGNVKRCVEWVEQERITSLRAAVEASAKANEAERALQAERLAHGYTRQALEFSCRTAIYMNSEDESYVRYVLGGADSADLYRLAEAMAAGLDVLMKCDPKDTSTVFNWCHFCDFRQHEPPYSPIPISHKPDCPWFRAQAALADWQKGTQG